MNKQITEGEWIAQNFMNEASIYCPSKKVGIAKLIYSQFPYSENEVIANARLIAAAPNLLDAAQSVLTTLKELVPNATFDGMIWVLEIAIDKAIKTQP